MPLLSLPSRILFSGLTFLVLVQNSYALVPTNPPSTSSAPAGGYFSRYFQNMTNNPCGLPGQAVVGFNATAGNTYITPNCSYLFWLLNAGGEIQYTGNSRIDGNLVVTANVDVGGVTTSNINTTTINGFPLSNYVSVPNLSNLTSGSIPKAINSLNPNMLGNSNIYENAGGYVGIGTSSPGAPLEIKSVSDNPLRLTQPDAGDGWNYIEFNSNAGRRWWMGTDNSGVFTISKDGSAATQVHIANSGLQVDNELIVNGATKLNSTIQIATGAGAGKVLTSDASGNARWQASTTGGGPVFSDLSPTYIFPSQAGTNIPRYFDIYSFSKNINARCTSGKVKISVTDREAGDWPDPGTSYTFGAGGRAINTTNLLFDQFSNELHVDVGGWMNGSELDITNISASWADWSPGWGGVQLRAECTNDGEVIIGTMCDTNVCGSQTYSFTYTKDVGDYNVNGLGTPSLVRVIVPGGFDGDWMNGGNRIDYLFGADYPLKFNTRYVVYNAGSNWLAVTVTLNSGNNKINITIEGDDGSPSASGPIDPTYEVYYSTVSSPDRTYAAVVPNESLGTSGISWFSEQWCTSNGGSVVDITPDRSSVCKANGGSCSVIPGTPWIGVRKFQDWGTNSTTPRTCSDSHPRGCHATPPTSCTVTTIASGFQNLTYDGVNNSCMYNNGTYSFVDGCDEVTNMCTQTLSEIGCY